MIILLNHQLSLYIDLNSINLSSKPVAIFIMILANVYLYVTNA